MPQPHKYWLLTEGPADALMAEPCNDRDTSRALAVYRGDQSVKETIAFRRAYGRKLYDHVPTTALWFMLYSETFFSVMVANQLTGWKSYPVSLSTPKVEYLVGYRGLVVTGRCGPVLSELSRVATKLPHDANLYGLGEVAASSGFRRDPRATTQAIFNRDPGGTPEDSNLYGAVRRSACRAS